MCRKERDLMDAFVVHYFEASFSIGTQLKQILATGFRNESQWETTWRAIVARAVTILKPRNAGHNFTERWFQVAQPNVLRLKHVGIGVNNFFCTRHCVPLLYLNSGFTLTRPSRAVRQRVCDRSGSFQRIVDGDPLAAVELLQEFFLI